MPVADVRYLRRGVSKVYFVPTIASSPAPTAAEVNAGTNLTATIADIAGFSYTNQPITTPDLADNFDGKITGVDQTADSTLHIYEKRTTNTGRTTLVKGTAGYLVILFSGTAGASPAAGDKADVWPVISAGTPRDYSMTEAAKWHVALIVTGRPNEDVALV
jgi:hypothetical protein